MSSDSNKYHMKYSAFSNQKDKYFLIHSVWQITGKLVHMRVYLRSCSYKQSTSRCATKTNHLSECEVSGKPLLALWIWWSHWWSVSLRRAQKRLGLFGWYWLWQWFAAVELNIVDGWVGNGVQAVRMSIAHSARFQST